MRQRVSGFYEIQNTFSVTYYLVTGLQKFPIVQL